MTLRVILLACLSGACSVNKQPDIVDSSSIASVDVQLPDKSKMSDKLQRALSHYSFEIVAAVGGGCEVGNVSQTGEYTSAVRFEAKLLQRCNYSYSIMLGSKEQLAKFDSIYFAQGAIESKDLQGKPAYSLNVTLYLSETGRALGFGQDMLQTEPGRTTDVSIVVDLPIGAEKTVAERVAADETVTTKGIFSHYTNIGGSGNVVEFTVDGTGEKIYLWIVRNLGPECPATTFDLSSVSSPDYLAIKKLNLEIVLKKLKCQTTDENDVFVRAEAIKEI